MSENASLSMHHALTDGLSKVTLERTVELFNAHQARGDERTLNFRGDLAEHNNYDKIKPTRAPVQTHGHVVFIEAVSQKTGAIGHYQIQANQWKLLEVLAYLG